ncbi:unnamed protein product [Brassica oleracea var. botrytis]
MANRSNQRRHDAPPPTLTLTEMEASHHADHRAFMLKFCGTRINVTVTNKAEAVRRWIRNTRYANKNHLRRSNRTSMRCSSEFSTVATPTSSRKLGFKLQTSTMSMTFFLLQSNTKTRY